MSATTASLPQRREPVLSMRGFFRTADVLAAYYILNSSIYLAPSVYNVVNQRMVRELSLSFTAPPRALKLTS